MQMKSFEESFSDCFDIVQKIADGASTTSGKICQGKGFDLIG